MYSWPPGVLALWLASPGLAHFAREEFEATTSYQGTPQGKEEGWWEGAGQERGREGGREGWKGETGREGETGVGRERGGRGRNEGWREAGRERVGAQAEQGVGVVGLVYSVKKRSALREALRPSLGRLSAEEETLHSQTLISVKERSAMLREDLVNVDFPWDAVGRIQT